MSQTNLPHFDLLNFLGHGFLRGWELASSCNTWSNFNHNFSTLVMLVFASDITHVHFVASQSKNKCWWIITTPSWSRGKHVWLVRSRICDWNRKESFLESPMWPRTTASKTFFKLCLRSQLDRFLSLPLTPPARQYTYVHGFCVAWKKERTRGTLRYA